MPYRPRDERYVDWRGVQKDVGHLVACVVGGEHEWGHTKIVGNVDVGPRTDQQPRRGDIVPVNGPRDGRSPPAVAAQTGSARPFLGGDVPGSLRAWQ